MVARSNRTNAVSNGFLPGCRNHALASSCLMACQRSGNMYCNAAMEVASASECDLRFNITKALIKCCSEWICRGCARLQ
eukprot:6609403-Lingulodinium_polyedra.AAC.1